MPFEALAGLGLPRRATDAMRRAWVGLSRAGSRFNGRTRIEIASQARDARAGRVLPTSGPQDGRTRAVRVVAAAPWAIDQETVDSVLATDLDPAAYVEVVGVVSRVAAVDAVHFAMGVQLEPLPSPRPGKPTGTTDKRARQGRAFVPMVGGMSIVDALSLVPSEAAAQEDLHVLYLSYEEMADLEISRGLDRAQMELVAARVSAINECFY